MIAGTEMMKNATTMQRQRGYTLIEIMVALTIGIILSTILSLIFVANASFRNDLDRSSRLVENGSYALQRVSGDVMMAQLYAELDFVANWGKTIPLGTAKPDPCLTTLAGLRGAGGTDLPLRFGIQGYSAPSATTVPDLTGTTCAALLTPTATAQLQPGSDILVVRHTEPCDAGPTTAAGCDAPVAGRPYFQATHCSDEAQSPNLTCSTAAPVHMCGLDTDTTTLTLHNIGIDCATGATTVASYHRFYVDIYYVSTEDKAGDGIPTLKLAQLDAVGGATSFGTPQSIAEGIEAMHLEYGIDDSAGTIDGVPDFYVVNPDNDVVAANSMCGAAAKPCAADWGNVMTVKINLLARNTEATPTLYINDKTFTLGGTTYGPFNDRFKRHVYQATVRLHNPADRRQP
jgi:type IV pilus assembly protein PilW